jgi:hypothetical protein
MQRKREQRLHSPPKSAEGGMIFRASEHEAFCDTTVELFAL